MSARSASMSCDSADFLNRPPGFDGTHFPVTLISSPIFDGSDRKLGIGSAV